MTTPLLFAPHGIKHVSPSQLDTFLRCPWFWHCQYIQKLPRKASGALITGSAAHHALAHFFRYKRKLKKRMEEIALLTSFSDDFDRKVKKEAAVDWGVNKQGEPLDEGKVKDRGVVALRAFAKELLPDINPVAVEVLVRRDIPGTDIFLKGYADIMEAEAIRDHKFTATMKNEDVAHQSRQLDAYAWMAQRPPDLSRSGALRLLDLRWRGIHDGPCWRTDEDKSELEVSLEVATFGGKAKRLASTRSRARLEFYEKNVLARVVTAMHQCLQSGNFPCHTEGWQCSARYCDFWGECMGKVR